MVNLEVERKAQFQQADIHRRTVSFILVMTFEQAFAQSKISQIETFYCDKV
jgi:hypothetical protein